VQVAEEFADDASVQVLFAESVMNLYHWRYWSADGKVPSLLAGNLTCMCSDHTLGVFSKGCAKQEPAFVNNEAALKQFESAERSSVVYRIGLVALL
jgi:hypothetical protein